MPKSSSLYTSFLTPSLLLPPPLLLSLPLLLLKIATLTIMNWYLSVILICISQMVTDDKKVFIYPLVICMEMCIQVNFIFFFQGLMLALQVLYTWACYKLHFLMFDMCLCWLSLLLSCRICLYSLPISPLSDRWFANLFFRFVICFYHFHQCFLCFFFFESIATFISLRQFSKIWISRIKLHV